MKNQEQIISTVQSILDNMSSADLVKALDNLQCSQGPFSADYLIGKDYFTQEVVDFCQSIDFAQENSDAYCLAIQHIAESIQANPKDYYLDQDEIDNFTEEDYAELAESDGWVWVAYEHLLMKIFQEVANDMEGEEEAKRLEQHWMSLPSSQWTKETMLDFIYDQNSYSHDGEESITHAMEELLAFADLQDEQRELFRQVYRDIYA
jgi:hypothetical protein